MEKLKQNANRLDKILYALEIACIVGAVAAGVGLLIIGAALLFQLDPQLIGTGYDSLDLGFLELELAQGYTPDPNLILGITAVELAMGIAVALIGKKCLMCVRKFVSPMKAGNCFHDTAADNLKSLAVYSLILGVAINVAEYIGHLMVQYGYGLQALFVGEKITGVSFYYEPNLTCFGVAVILMFLSYVFRHGQSLQQLSDETL